MYVHYNTYIYVFCCYVYDMIGVQLFKGALHYRCFPLGTVDTDSISMAMRLGYCAGPDAPGGSVSLLCVCVCVYVCVCVFLSLSLSLSLSLCVYVCLTLSMSLYI